MPKDLFSGSRFCILQLIVNKRSIKSIGGNVLWWTINIATQSWLRHRSIRYFCCISWKAFSLPWHFSLSKLYKQDQGKLNPLWHFQNPKLHSSSIIPISNRWLTLIAKLLIVSWQKINWLIKCIALMYEKQYHFIHVSCNNATISFKY